MKLFLNHIKESIRYAFSDKKAILIISALMAITSFIYKNASINPILKLITVTMLLVVGYGSYVSWHAINGSDEHPNFKNINELIWEGFKKTVINFIYGGFLVLIFLQSKQNFINGKLIITVCFSILFILIYLFLIGGLLNRYLHKGKFLKAFNIVEIYGLTTLFDIKSLMKVLIAVIISQLFAVTVFLGPVDTTSEFIYSISTFFLAPFLYITNKRFVGLNVRELMENRK